MSDAGRKDFTDKIKESAKPDSQKNVWEQGKEAVTDGADKFGRETEPKSEKGIGQKIGDTISNLTGGNK